MIVFVNDDPEELPEGASLSDLKAKLGLKDKGFAFSKNEQIVPQCDHSNCILEDQDHIIVIEATQGG